MVLSRSTQPRLPMEPDKLQVVAGHHAQTGAPAVTIEMPSKLSGLDVNFAYQRRQVSQSTSTSHALTEATDLQPAPAPSAASGSFAGDLMPSNAASGAAPQVLEMVASDATAAHIVAGLSAELDALLLEVEQVGQITFRTWRERNAYVWGLPGQCVYWLRVGPRCPRRLVPNVVSRERFQTIRDRSPPPRNQCRL